MNDRHRQRDDNTMSARGRIAFVVATMVLVSISLAWAAPSTPEDPRILGRETWDATPAVVEKMLAQSPIDTIVVHHSEGSTPGPASEARVLRGIQEYHQSDKGWGDTAYHFLIAPSGRIYRGRDERYVGDSATKYDLRGKLLICMLGSYQSKLPTFTALKSLTWLVREKMTEYRVPLIHVCGHCDLAESDCPGKLLYQWLKNWLRLNRVVAR